MQQLLTPARAGLDVARHLAWYISHQLAAAPRVGD